MIKLWLNYSQINHMKLSPYQQFLLIFFIFPAGSSLFHLRPPSWFRSCFRFLHLSFHMHVYSSMISSAEFLADFWEGHFGKFSAQVHCNLSWECDVPCPLLWFKSSGLMSKYLATASWIVVQFKTFALFADSMSFNASLASSTVISFSVSDELLLLCLRHLQVLWCLMLSCLQWIQLLHLEQ